MNSAGTKKRLGEYSFFRLLWNNIQMLKWRVTGSSGTVPALKKQATVKEYARNYQIKNLVETGTYLGDMVEATKNIFGEIYSIELDTTLYEKAKRRFAKFNNINLLQGDSAKVLPELLKEINEPCLFWLDAHYSGGITANNELPIKTELTLILRHPIKEHIILIDDARLFTGKTDYPSIEQVEEVVKEERPDLTVQVAFDIIRISKKRVI